MSLSGIKDIDREILKHVDDSELLKICSIDRKTWYYVCDDPFLKRRLSKYPDIEKYKTDETWKRFFLIVVNYVNVMNKKFDFQYTFGDFKTQYAMLNTYKGNELLKEAATVGELSLVIFSLKDGADVHADNEYAFIAAVVHGHLNIVKILIEEYGANIHEEDDEALISASENGHLDIVKYLVEKGVDIHSNENIALRWASAEGRECGRSREFDRQKFR